MKGTITIMKYRYILTIKMTDRNGREIYKELTIVSSELTEDEYNDSLYEFKSKNNDCSNFVLINSLKLLRV